MSDETPEPGTILAGKLRIERVIGRGGMGVVLEATHIHLDQRVAVKLLLPQALGNPDLVGRFMREARAAARIKSEHVTRVHDVLTLDDGKPLLVMEYLEGIDLAGYAQEARRLPVGEAIEYVLQACEAIAEAHGAGIVHRDLKPENLFLTHRADGSSLVKVLDFGISKIAPRPGSAAEDSHTKTAALMGSPVYMSPEQLRSTRDVDPRTDLWSLGVVLFELLTGSLPFTAETIPQLCTMILNDPPAKARAIRPDLPVGLEAVLERCLAKDPSERYASVADLARALAPFAPPSAQVSIDRVTSAPSLPNLSRGHASGANDTRPTLDLEMAQTEAPAAIPQAPAPPPPRRLGYVAAAAVVVVGVALWLVPRHPMPPTESSALAAKAPPAAAPPPPSAAPAASPPEPAHPAAVPTSAASSPPDEATPAPPRDRKANERGPAKKPHPASSAAEHHAPAANCDPPFVIDANGIERYKPSCL